ncbi:MAG: hypothetical protein KDB90_16925 [Planctomycetes bacterium]|nr:hypothetical protein [Planctomycetota bacterium]
MADPIIITPGAINGLRRVFVDLDKWVPVADANEICRDLSVSYVVVLQCGEVSFTPGRYAADLIFLVDSFKSVSQEQAEAWVTTLVRNWVGSGRANVFESFGVKIAVSQRRADDVSPTDEFVLGPYMPLMRAVQGFVSVHELNNPLAGFSIDIYDPSR